MNDVIATIAGSATIQEVQTTRTRRATPANRSGVRHGAVGVQLPSRCAREHWYSTLSEDDLENLLQILEADLIPQLLSGYSPGSPSAAHSEE